MKYKKLILIMSILAMAIVVSPASAQMMGNGWPYNQGGPTNHNGSTNYNGWGCFPSGPGNPGSPNGPTSGWCGFYNSANLGSMGMVSTQAVVMHILFPALAPNCPISQLTDWQSKPERVNHFNVSGQIDYYFVMTYLSGRLTKVELFNATDTLVTYTECFYNPGGQLVKTLSYDATGAELSHTNFIYNTAGQLLNVRMYVNGQPAYTLRCIYNANGRIARVSQLKPTGALQMYTKCFYNGIGQLNRTVSFSSMGAVLETRTYAYNTAGKMMRVSDYNNMGASNGYSRYMRNRLGQPTHTYFYNALNTQIGSSFCYFNLP